MPFFCFEHVKTIETCIFLFFGLCFKGRTFVLEAAHRKVVIRFRLGLVFA